MQVNFIVHTGWTPAIPLQRTLVDVLDYWRISLRESIAAHPGTE